MTLLESLFCVSFNVSQSNHLHSVGWSQFLLRTSCWHRLNRISHFSGEATAAVPRGTGGVEEGVGAGSLVTAAPLDEAVVGGRKSTKGLALRFAPSRVRHSLLCPSVHHRHRRIRVLSLIRRTIVRSSPFEAKASYLMTYLYDHGIFRRRRRVFSELDL